MDLGAQLRMDVPFFISSIPMALGTHYGKNPPLHLHQRTSILRFMKVHNDLQPKLCYQEALRQRNQANSEGLIKAIYEQNTQGNRQAHTHNGLFSSRRA